MVKAVDPVTELHDYEFSYYAECDNCGTIQLLIIDDPDERGQRPDYCSGCGENVHWEHTLHFEEALDEFLWLRDEK